MFSINVKMRLTRSGSSSKIYATSETLWSNVWMTGSTTITAFRSRFPHPTRSPLRGHINNYWSIMSLIFPLNHRYRSKLQRYVYGEKIHSQNSPRGRQCEGDKSIVYFVTYKFISKKLCMLQCRSRLEYYLIEEIMVFQLSNVRIGTICS